MASPARWLRFALVIAVFFGVGGGLLYLGYRISPDINDRSIPLSEWRSQNKLGSAVTSLGEVSILLGGILVWAAVRRDRKHRRHHAYGEGGGSEPPPHG